MSPKTLSSVGVAVAGVMGVCLAMDAPVIAGDGDGLRF